MHKTLVLHGTADSIQPLRASEWLASQLPNSRLEILEGAGHVPTVTRGAEVATAINSYFL